MRAAVAGTITFRAEDCPAKVLEQLVRDLSFPNPEYVSRLRLGRYLGAVPEKICCVLQRSGLIELPRGAAGLLRRRIKASGDTVEFEDRRSTFEPAGFVADVQLRPYQQEALEWMRRGLQGYVVMPCGAGKTVTGVATIAAIDQPTLIVVHTSDLLEQWRQTVRQILSIDAGIVAEGKRTLGPVTVATVQTLVRMPADELRKLGTGFGCVVVDEAHHAPASTFQTVLAAMPARYRFGLTATPKREDGLAPLLRLTLGEQLFSVDYGELVAGGYLQVPEIRYVYTAFEFDYGGAKDHQRCMAALTSDGERNATIADLAAREANDRHTVLVLSGRVEHCRRLGRLIRERGVGAKVLVGATGKGERQKILTDFRDGTVPVVVASTLADEGLDVPRLDRIILAFPGRARSRTTQRLGRLMRLHPGKSAPVLFDVVDASVTPLMRQFRERRRAYKKLLGEVGAAA